MSFTHVEGDHYLVLARDALELHTSPPPVNKFTGLQVKSDLNFDDSNFWGVVDFSNTSVDGATSFTGALFNESANFRSLKVGSDFDANRAVFLNTEKEKVIFVETHVSGNMFIENATFNGPVDFRSIHVGNILNMSGSRFMFPKSEAVFANMVISSDAVFKNVQFYGPVSFHMTEVNGSFNASNAMFINRNSVSNSKDIKYNKFLEKKYRKCINNASYHTSHHFFDFSSIPKTALDVWHVIQGPFSTKDISSCELSKSRSELKFDSMKISGSLVFDKARFESSINLRNTVVENFASLESLNFYHVPCLDLSHSNLLFMDIHLEKPHDYKNYSLPNEIKSYGMEYRYFSIKNTRENKHVAEEDNEYEKNLWSEFSCNILNQNDFSDFHSSLKNFYSSREDNETAREILFHHYDRNRDYILSALFKVWDLIAMKGLINYGRSPLRSLFISIILIILGGFIFSPLSICRYKLTEKSLNKIQVKLKSNDIPPDLLNSLQRIVDEEKDMDRGEFYQFLDKIITNDSRRKQYQSIIEGESRYTPIRYIKNQFISYLKNELWPLLKYIGWDLFKPKGWRILLSEDWFFKRDDKMYVIDKKEAEYEYNAFWYSLDVFLPFIDLWAANYWSPKNDHKFTRSYVGFLRISGWILIPTFIIAISGLLETDIIN